jgi:putative ABC transport system permease protein
MSLAWAMVRHRFAGFVGTFVAVTLGVAVIAGSLTLWASARPKVPAWLSGAPVVVRAPQIGQVDEAPFEAFRPWSDAEVAELVGRLSAVPGVTAAVPDRTFYVQRVVDGRAVGDPNESLHSGHGWSSAALAAPLTLDGRAPDRAGTVVVDRRLGLHPGAPIAVLTAEGPATWRVSGTVDGP